MPDNRWPERAIRQGEDVEQKGTTEEDRAIGARIKALRKVRGLSQTALATALGVTFQQVQKYENGQNRVSAGRLQVVAKFFEVSVSSLYGDDTEASAPSDTWGSLGLPGAIELLRAFASIENADLRRHVLGIASSAARMSTGRVAGNG